MGRKARELTWGNTTKTVADWSAAYGVPESTILARFKLGWEVGRAVSTPSDRRFRPGRPAAHQPRAVPALKRHRTKGTAYVQFLHAGQRHHATFGPWGSPEAKAAYERWVLEWSAGVARFGKPGQALTVSELVRLYADYCDRVEPLLAGATEAPDNPPVTSVPAADVEAVLGSDALHAVPARRELMRSLIRFHLLMGGRPGEVLKMRPCEVDRRHEVWRYTVPLPKGMQKRRREVYFLGPRVRAILTPLLAGLEPELHVWRFAPRRAGARWIVVTRATYQKCVAAACAAARVPHWHPHQLRHNRASGVLREFESNAAAATAIGDSEEVAREVYADPLDAVRVRIARQMG